MNKSKYKRLLKQVKKDLVKVEIDLRSEELRLIRLKAKKSAIEFLRKALPETRRKLPL